MKEGASWVTHAATVHAPTTALLALLPQHDTTGLTEPGLAWWPSGGRPQDAHARVQRLRHDLKETAA